MEIKIYKLIKPNDPMTVYIGRTTQSLSDRFSGHKSDSKRYTHRNIYQWFDNTCMIELIEIYNGSEYNIREVQIIQEYIDNGYKVMNELIGKFTLNKTAYIKANNIKSNKNNDNRNLDYHNWTSMICRKAKKEGLTSKQYRSKYNIPEYSGPKKNK